MSDDIKKFKLNADAPEWVPGGAPGEEKKGKKKNRGKKGGGGNGGAQGTPSNQALPGLDSNAQLQDVMRRFGAGLNSQGGGDAALQQQALLQQQLMQQHLQQQALQQQVLLQHQLLQAQQLQKGEKGSGSSGGLTIQQQLLQQQILQAQQQQQQAQQGNIQSLVEKHRQQQLAQGSGASGNQLAQLQLLLLQQQQLQQQQQQQQQQLGGVSPQLLLQQQQVLALLQAQKKAQAAAPQQQQQQEQLQQMQQQKKLQTPQVHPYFGVMTNMGSLEGGSQKMTKAEKKKQQQAQQAKIGEPVQGTPTKQKMEIKMPIEPPTSPSYGKVLKESSEMGALYQDPAVLGAGASGGALDPERIRIQGLLNQVHSQAPQQEAAAAPASDDAFFKFSAGVLSQAPGEASSSTAAAPSAPAVQPSPPEQPVPPVEPPPEAEAPAPAAQAPSAKSVPYRSPGRGKGGLFEARGKGDVAKNSPAVAPLEGRDEVDQRENSLLAALRAKSGSALKAAYLMERPAPSGSHVSGVAQFLCQPAMLKQAHFDEIGEPELVTFFKDVMRILETLKAPRSLIIPFGKWKRHPKASIYVDCENHAAEVAALDPAVKPNSRLTKKYPSDVVKDVTDFVAKMTPQFKEKVFADEAISGEGVLQTLFKMFNYSFAAIQDYEIRIVDPLGRNGKTTYVIKTDQARLPEGMMLDGDGGSIAFAGLVDVA